MASLQRSSEAACLESRINTRHENSIKSYHTLLQAHLWRGTIWSTCRLIWWMRVYDIHLMNARLRHSFTYRAE